MDDPVEDGDEPPIVRLHPEIVAAREAQLELDQLVEAFWALVNEVNRLLALVESLVGLERGAQRWLRGKEMFLGPMKTLRGRVASVTDSMRLLLSEHEHLSDQREAGWTGATEARSRAVELFDALRSVAVQSAMAVEAAAHVRFGVALAAKGADFTWPGWRAARRVADAEFRAADLILERMVRRFGERRVPAEDMEHWALTTALRVNDLEFASRDDRGFLGSGFLVGLEVGLAVLGIGAGPLKGIGAAVRAATRARLGPLMRVGTRGSLARGGRLETTGGPHVEGLPAGVARYLEQGYSPQAASKLATPYTGTGHHFVHRSYVNTLIKRYGADSLRGKFLRAFRDSPWNVKRPTWMTKGEFYEWHARLHGAGGKAAFGDPTAYGASLLPGEGWRYAKVVERLDPYGRLGYLWQGSPTRLKVAAAGAVGSLGAGGYAVWDTLTPDGSLGR